MPRSKQPRKGFVVVPQWYVGIETWKELTKGKRTGDAKAIEAIAGTLRVPEVHNAIPYCPVGHVVMEILPDGRLKIATTNYDTSG